MFNSTMDIHTVSLHLTQPHADHLIFTIAEWSPQTLADKARATSSKGSVGIHPLHSNTNKLLCFSLA